MVFRHKLPSSAGFPSVDRPGRGGAADARDPGGTVMMDCFRVREARPDAAVEEAVCRTEGAYRDGGLFGKCLVRLSEAAAHLFEDAPEHLGFPFRKAPELPLGKDGDLRGLGGHDVGGAR
jgi:hypothetical protein